MEGEMPPSLLIAKVKGFPWWIAKESLSPDGSGPKKDKTFVYFFGTKKCGWVHSRDGVRPFFDNVKLVAPKFNDAKMKAALVEAAEYLSLQPTEAETETRFRRTVQSFGGELPTPCTDGERNTTRSSTPATPKESSPTPELGAERERTPTPVLVNACSQAGLHNPAAAGSAAAEDKCYDKCYECKFGRFALRKNSAKQCRSEIDSAVKGAMGHTACNWQDDVRTAAFRTELEAAAAASSRTKELQGLLRASQRERQAADSRLQDVLRASQRAADSAPPAAAGIATADDKCYECKFGQFALRKNSPRQCRSSLGSAVKGAMGHTTACRWQDDERTTALMIELEAPKKVIKAAGAAAASKDRNSLGERSGWARAAERGDLDKDRVLKQASSIGNEKEPKSPGESGEGEDSALAGKSDEDMNEGCAQGRSTQGEGRETVEVTIVRSFPTRESRVGAGGVGETLREEMSGREEVAGVEEARAKRRKMVDQAGGDATHRSCDTFLGAEDDAGVSKLQWWVGAGEARAGEGGVENIHYGGFIRSDVEFVCGDCAVLRPATPHEDPYVMLIRDMWQDLEGAMWFKGQWFYRPVDLSKRPLGGLLSYELVLSNWLDVNPIASVIAKASVLFLEQASTTGELEFCSRTMSFPFQGQRYEHLCCRTLAIKSYKLAFLGAKAQRLRKEGASSSSAGAVKQPGEETTAGGGVALSNGEGSSAGSGMQERTGTGVARPDLKESGSTRAQPGGKGMLGDADPVDASGTSEEDEWEEEGNVNSGEEDDDWRESDSAMTSKRSRSNCGKARRARQSCGGEARAAREWTFAGEQVRAPADCPVRSWPRPHAEPTSSKAPRTGGAAGSSHQERCAPAPSRASAAACRTSAPGGAAMRHALFRQREMAVRRPGGKPGRTSSGQARPRLISPGKLAAGQHPASRADAFTHASDCARSGGQHSKSPTNGSQRSQSPTNKSAEGMQECRGGGENGPSGGSHNGATICRGQDESDEDLSDVQAERILRREMQTLLQQSPTCHDKHRHQPEQPELSEQPQPESHSKPTSLKLMQAEAEEDARLRSIGDIRSLPYDMAAHSDEAEKGPRARGRVEIMDDDEM